MTNEELEHITSGACIKWDGTICKSGEFTSRMHFKDSKYKPSTHELNEIEKVGSLDYSRLDDIENPNIYEWYVVGYDKYGRSMYCPKTGLKRTQTMGEFYGNATVD